MLYALAPNMQAEADDGDFVRYMDPDHGERVGAPEHALPSTGRYIVEVRTLRHCM